MIIQVLGLIFNFYLVFLFITKNNSLAYIASFGQHYNKSLKRGWGRLRTLSTFNWLQHTSKNAKSLNRIGIL
jgi:hypothetical protein